MVKEEEEWQDDALVSLPSIDKDDKTLKKLDEVGIHTVEMLATVPEIDLLDAGFTDEKVERFHTQAMAECDDPVEFMNVEDIVRLPKLSTGSEGWNEIMGGGGYQIGEITELSGLWGMGKSTSCMTAAVECWRQYHTPSVYIHTELQQVFTPEFPAKIAEARGVSDYDVKTAMLYVKCKNSTAQVWAAKQVDSHIKRMGAKLLMVDSVGGRFRAEYPGQAYLARRGQKMNKHLTQLALLANAFKMAVIVTNHVHADPSGSAQVPTMGHITHYAIGKLVLIRNVGSIVTKGQYKGSMYIKGVGDKGVREVILLKAFGLPQRSCFIQVSDKGISDVGEAKKD
jgi:meiotic recombination protein DMC1